MLGTDDSKSVSELSCTAVNFVRYFDRVLWYFSLPTIQQLKLTLVCHMLKGNQFGISLFSSYFLLRYPYYPWSSVKTILLHVAANPCNVAWIEADVDFRTCFVQKWVQNPKLSRPSRSQMYVHQHMSYLLDGCTYIICTYPYGTLLWHKFYKINPNNTANPNPVRLTGNSL